MAIEWINHQIYGAISYLLLNPKDVDTIEKGSVGGDEFGVVLPFLHGV
jgi:hypothetical protein